jgi:predicted amidohydrolase
MWIKVFFALLTFSLGAWAQQKLNTQKDWRIWSPRAEIQPLATLPMDGSLALSGAGNPAVFGGWVKPLNEIQAGQWYRFEAEYSTAGLRRPWNQVLVRLEWKDAKGKRAGEIDFAWQEERHEGRSKVWEEAPAPPGAVAAELQLYLYDSEGGAVRFHHAHFERVTAPRARKVRLAAVRYRPQKVEGGQANVKSLVAHAKQKVEQADLIVLGESITTVGSAKSFADVAEPADGPSARILGELARVKRSYVVAGIVEREGASLYNTAILLNREGKLAGKYRKVHLPHAEIEGGLRPGSEFPVFSTDFGKLGLMICYDVFFSEAAKALSLGGAEVIAMPIWGGNEVLAQSRSVEGRVFLVSSGYDHPTYVQDPNGIRLSEAQSNGSVAYAEVDLNRRYPEKWLGDMKAHRMRETRTEVNTPDARRVHP